jgi:hypothetical protein
MSSQHEDFLEGLRDSAVSEAQYLRWLADEGFSEIDRIDLEAGGYEAGLEVGHRISGNR